ncbi:hypothetical protein EVAR_91078_1 [Eumeta japonica]|uniref:Uncharacterized protein n=1 Tax=Eumeta variegata TaxID=151549 RepID=A0A4C1SRU3_EUMVA|nr:hypothetical protein EVAR_91078_1 [Eumeta japonica]
MTVQNVPQQPLPVSNSLEWSNIQWQYPNLIQPAPVQIPYQYSIPMQWQYYNAPFYYPTAWNNLWMENTVQPQHQQEDNIISEDMDISQSMEEGQINNNLVAEGQMELPTSSNERSSLNKQPPSTTNDAKWYRINSAFKDNIVTYGIPKKKEIFSLKIL